MKKKQDPPKKLLSLVNDQIQLIRNLFDALNRLVDVSVQGDSYAISLQAQALQKLSHQFHASETFFFENYFALCKSFQVTGKMPLSELCQKFDFSLNNQLRAKSIFLKKLIRQFKPILIQKQEILAGLSSQVDEILSYMKNLFQQENTYSPYGTVRQARFPEGMNFNSKI